MKTPTWIPIDRKQIRDYQTSHSEGGVETMFAPSPYDLPDAVAVDSDVTTGSVWIRFHYLEPERTEAYPVRKDITFYIGRHSRRLYAVEISVNNVRKIDAVRRAFQDAVSVMAANVPQHRKANFRAAREAVENSTEALVRAAATTR
jgi:hypothetical protein